MTTWQDLATALRGPDACAALFARADPSAVMAAAGEEGVDALIAYFCPDVAACADRRRRAVLEEEVRARAMARVAAGFADGGLRGVIVKGGALAYTHYPAPWTRPRLDLDILVTPDERLAAAGTLAQLGYARAGRLQGELVNHQDAYECAVAPGMSHTVDLHWQITNRALLISRLPSEGLVARAVPAPFAGAAAWQLDPVDHLLVACAHRAAHHAGDTKLIWLLDVSLLARAMSAVDVREFADRAIGCAIASLCARDLSEASVLFGGTSGALDPEVIAGLARRGAREPARALLGAERGVLGDVWADLCALRRFRDRAQLVREHLLPPPEYMRASSGGRASAWLPWLYIRRASVGLVEWITEAFSGTKP